MAFLNSIRTGLGSAFLLILYQGLVLSLILTLPHPSIKHISPADHCCSQPWRRPPVMTHLLVSTLLWSLLLHCTMLVCVCVTNSILQKWWHGRSLPKLGYKRLTLSLSHITLREASCFSLSWGVLGKVYTVKNWSLLLIAMWVNLEVESNQVFRDQTAPADYLTATSWQSRSQNSRTAQLSCSWIPDPQKRYEL